MPSVLGAAVVVIVIPAANTVLPLMPLIVCDGIVLLISVVCDAGH